MEVVLDNDGVYKHITRGCLIITPTPEFDGEPQAYRIYDTVKNMSSNTMTVYARHIQFDLNKKVVFNKNVQGNGQQVLTKLLEDTNFTGTSESNITDIRQYKMRNITNVLAGNEADSFLNVWGGEIECNNYKLNIPLKRGKDKGVRVTFGYNLEDIEEDLNADEIVTRIFPYSGDLVLSGNTPYVDSPLIAKYQEVYEQAIEMSDIKVKEKSQDSEGNDTTSKDAEGFETRAEAEAEMIKRCKKLFDEGADKIKANYKVKMKDLSKTIEYKQLGYDVLEKICLGDTVHCYNKNIDIEVSARCISYEWDIVNQEFIEIELGQFISNFMDSNLNDLDNLYRKIVLEKQYILLRVDSLDNAMHTEIKLTEEAIRAEAEDTKKGLLSTIELTAKGISTNVENLKNNTSTQINQLSNEISTKVTEEEMWSSITENASKITATVYDGTEHNVILDGDGLKVQNGAFKIEDSDGNVVFWINNDGVLRATHLWANDLTLNEESSETGSSLWNVLYNMESMTVKEVKVKYRLTLDEDNFYINNGYTLKEYIEKIIEENK